MDDKRKDKIIMGLIIVVVALFANNYVKNNEDDLLGSEISLLDTSSDALSPADEDENVEINEMKVYISGEISKEGVYEFEDGDRLDDLIKKAGGLTENANAKDLNLAMKLEDEMKIYIPSIYEISSDDTADTIPIITSDSKDSSKDKININKASKEELMSLPNIGDKRADSILEYRESNKFETIEDIKNVNGIGEKFYQSLKDLITV
ncbi:helix-hairpin-helix domain-containing protein [Anaerococcus sp. Marseille-Q7828]|uniref:helix-hairpin-helix domain-containing protein n=1 Tax=Anaerococcus sp. Marseille-Q7828 TaxID=3036300 RepID=UPI0024ADCE89|nr:helix-hairpin-helix domain-containing protein [Anaerococcus sp. Marseille-Q7828]